jgi:phosphoribosylformylglycinamidine synthase
MDLESQIQDFVLKSIDRQLIQSAHDVSDGGIAVAIAESCIWGQIGLAGDTHLIGGSKDASLFGEAQSRIILSVLPGNCAQFESLAEQESIPFFKLGTVRGINLDLPGIVNVTIDEMTVAWKNALADSLLKS